MYSLQLIRWYLLALEYLLVLVCHDNELISITDWHIAVQVLECLGLVGVLVFAAMVCYTLYQQKTSPLTGRRAGLLLLSGNCSYMYVSC